LSVGVLALQGDVREHINLIDSLGFKSFGVKTVGDLDKSEALVIPGGESTAISKLLVTFGLMDPVRQFVRNKPVLGTCAGLILLSDQVEGRLPDQELIGGLPIKVSRNAYGGQTHSFEAEIDISGETENVAFIRAPRILDSGPTRVIASLDGYPVAIQHGKIFGASFHPELTGAKVLHRLFLDAI
jgi:pyridoxal 5'-phosphate synthase pdxT subunit